MADNFTHFALKKTIIQSFIVNLIELKVKYNKALKAAVLSYFDSCLSECIKMADNCEAFCIKTANYLVSSI